MSPQQRPGRVTPSKKQLAQGSSSKGSSRKGGANAGGSSKGEPGKGGKGGKGGQGDAGKGRRGASGGKGGASSTKARSTPLDDAAEGKGTAAPARKGRVPEARAVPARTGLLSRLVPPRPVAEPAADVDADPGDDGGEGGGTVEATTAAPVEAPSDGRRYGAGAILLVFLGAQVLASIAYAIAIPPSDYDPGAVTGLGGRVGQASWQVATGVDPVALSQPVPLWLSTLIQVPLWGALVLGPMWFAWKRGRGVVADLGLRMKPVDVPIGLAIGAACQLLLVPALYWLVFKAIGVQDISAAARQLTDRATDPLSVVLVFLIVGIGAPIAEEIFFRGMALPIFRRNLRTRWAILASAAFFAATHFQLLQFPALLAFGVILGVLTVRSGRLGPAIWAHLGFNVVAATGLIFGIGWL